MNEKRNPMSSLRDNHKRGNIGEFLSEQIGKDSKLAFVSAYFTIYAYQQLKNRLDGIDNLRFLFGEPRFISSIDPAKTDKKQFQIEDDKLIIPMENRLAQRLAAKECHAWIKTKTEIKSMVKPNFLHGKMYHITKASGEKEAILGSSNFTVNGLGFGNSPNIELNIEITDKRDRLDLLNWFDELWNDDTGLVEDVKAQVLKYLEQLYATNSPEFIYYKTLYHLFEKFLGEQDASGLLTDKAGFFDSEIWNMLYSFQKDGVKGAINKLIKHNGCIIADSVGLGKTFEALAIIQYFEKINYRVLVLCPKKLKDNWTVYQSYQAHSLSPFRKDRFSYTVMYHTDLGRITGTSDANGIALDKFNWGVWDLIVIDESHNLRGNPKEKTIDDVTKFNRAKFLLEHVIKSGTKTKVLMLSATPVNTNLKDLRNQIHYITEGSDIALVDSMGIDNISNTLKTAQRQFTDWILKNKGKERNANELLQELDSTFFKLLDELTIARSRKHIMNYYKDFPFGSFPTRLKPIPMYSEIDISKRFYSYDKVNSEILEFQLSLYNPSKNLKPEFSAQYNDKETVLQFNQKKRESLLIGMMKVNFMKRLESSIFSFALTIERTLNKIERLEEKIEAYKENKDKQGFLNPEQIEPNENELSEEDILELEAASTVGVKYTYQLEHINLNDWLIDLRKDKDQLVSLFNSAKNVTPEHDAKLRDLKELIQKKVVNPINENNKKVLVFTAFVDTAQYLYDNIKDWVRQELNLHIAIVSGSALNKTTLKMPVHMQNDFNAILTCFSPVSKKRDMLKILPQNESIDILIATDCISEGQNLQDCDYMINYDIHWNPVRIIQRFGRIDRLKSLNASIQMVNFWPTKDLDKYIKLKTRVEARMALVDVTATGEENPFSDEVIEDMMTDDMKFRTKQLKKLQNEVIDLEDMEDSISISDFTLDDFRIDLMGYLETNRKELQEAPFGLYAVVPSPNSEHWIASDRFKILPSHKEIIRPGVIFCLKHNLDGKEYEGLNPLHPYFLIYIRNDGIVRYHYSNAKQILEMYRLLCVDKIKAIEELCNTFDMSTDCGKDMSKYDTLIKTAMQDIKTSINKRSQIQVQNSREAIIPIKPKTADTEFELITWLVIV